MTGLVAWIARWGVAILFGALLTSVVSGEASAKHRSGHMHARQHARHSITISHAENISAQPSRLVTMRYYGGPKSPMWGAPGEDVVSRSEARESARAALVAPQPTQQGPMRYYGGPKSPMWRGPGEN
jgi:hypothetical protein